jgi:hypothetical protein
MAASRLFLSNEALERWIAEGHAELDRDELRERPTGRRFRLREAVRFVSEVSGAPDDHDLLGKVKDVDQIAALAGERVSESVIVGDNAYEVQSGFLGALVEDTAMVQLPLEAPSAPSKPPDAVPAQQRQTIAALQAFFLNNVK